jgi:fermentation-respiration switch protein FrsA (DUF1100 family)
MVIFEGVSPMVHPKRAPASNKPGLRTREVQIPLLGLPGNLSIPETARALVIFVHGSGSSRLSPRNNAVATSLNEQGIATLLFDLLTPDEEQDRRNVFDIPLLARRLVDAVKWARTEPELSTLPIGLFGASTGAAAALIVAAELGEPIGAVVSRGGRPDLAGPVLHKVRTPTLLIVGGQDFGVIELNQAALAQLAGEKALRIIPGATHLFPEPGALETVMGEAARWFDLHLSRPRLPAS